MIWTKPPWLCSMLIFQGVRPFLPGTVYTPNMFFFSDFPRLLPLEIGPSQQITAPVERESHQPANIKTREKKIHRNYIRKTFHFHLYVIYVYPCPWGFSTYMWVICMISCTQTFNNWYLYLHSGCFGGTFVGKYTIYRVFGDIYTDKSCNFFAP